MRPPAARPRRLSIRRTMLAPRTPSRLQPRARPRSRALLLRLGVSPGRRHRGRHARRRRRRARLLPARRVLRRARSSITAFVFSDTARRDDGPAVRARRARGARSSTRPWTGSATRRSSPASLLWFAGGGDNTTLLRGRAGLPGRRRGHVVRQGPGRGLGHDLQRRDRRAHRAAGRRRWCAPASPGSCIAVRGPGGRRCGLLALATPITVVQRIVDGPPAGARRRPTARARRRSRERTRSVDLRRYAAGWRAVRRHARARWRTALFDARSPTRPGCAHGDARAAAGVATCPGRARTRRPRRAARAVARGRCGPTCATGARRSGCPS